MSPELATPTPDAQMFKLTTEQAAQLDRLGVGPEASQLAESFGAVAIEGSVAVVVSTNEQGEEVPSHFMDLGNDLGTKISTEGVPRAEENLARLGTIEDAYVSLTKPSAETEAAEQAVEPDTQEPTVQAEALQKPQGIEVSITESAAVMNVAHTLMSVYTDAASRGEINPYEMDAIAMTYTEHVLADAAASKDSKALMGLMRAGAVRDYAASSHTIDSLATDGLLDHETEALFKNMLSTLTGLRGAMPDGPEVRQAVADIVAGNVNTEYGPNGDPRKRAMLLAFAGGAVLESPQHAADFWYRLQTEMSPQV